MPRFLTISPTHISGKRKYAWEQCRDGGYVAIGWMDEDLTGKKFGEAKEIIETHDYDNEASAKDSFKKFLALDQGDYVAVTNASHGLFGIGEITSDYRFKLHAHDTGSEDEQDGYSHLRDVDWKVTSYLRREDIVGEGETAWAPYGTVGALRDELPVYIRRILGEVPTQDAPSTIEPPSELVPIIDSIEQLKADSEHKERGHESLVEDFFVALGHKKHEDVKFRRGRMDLSLWEGEEPVVIIEVKKDWGISPYSHFSAFKQAYGYALDQGGRYVLVTNGDDYILTDRLKGLTLEQNVIGHFQLSALQEGDLELINRLRPERLGEVNVRELFQHLSEVFRSEES